MSYKKVGGLHFVRIGRFGFSFFWSRNTVSRAAERRWRAAERRAMKAAANIRPCTVDSAGQYGMPFPDYQRYYR